MLDLPGARAPDHGAGAEEEERLEDRVIHYVQKGRAQAQREEKRGMTGHPDQTQAQAHRDDSDILDTGEREQALQLVLRERVENAQDSRDEADDEQDPAPPARR